ncbi:MAG TPA: hypothetical protein PK523_11605 [Elusimicrobiales bacterium]|nr:hypothetical protein [Elusimicrobiales bacterium]
MEQAFPERSFSVYRHRGALAARLRELGGEAHPGFLDQKEFFISVLRAAEEPLAALQREALRVVCAGFLEKLGRGRVTPELLEEFKDPLDKLLSSGDFLLVEGGLPGSPEVVRARLAALRPLSIAEGARTGTLRDPGGERLLTEAYRRLGFDRLEKGPPPGLRGDAALNELVLRARRSVAEYSRLYQVEPSAEETLTPFSLSRIDAALGACYRLLARLRTMRW